MPELTLIKFTTADFSRYCMWLRKIIWIEGELDGKICKNELEVRLCMLFPVEIGIWR